VEGLKSTISGAVQVAAVYVGTVVGAGFATGKEIVEFFVQYRFFGFIGIWISGLLFIWLGTKMMILSKTIGAKSYKDLNEWLFGKSAGAAVNFLMMIVLFGVTSVMLSGSGALFKEQLGVPYQIGIFITISLTVLIMIFGIKGVMGVNMFVVPMMVTFSIIGACNVMISENVYQSLLFLGDGFEHFLKSFLSPFAYAAFNLAMAQAVLVPLAYEMNDEKSMKWGGMLGGGILCVILLCSFLSLSAIPNIDQFEIPMAEVIKHFMSGMHAIFILVIYGEIFTSLIGDIFGLQKQLQQSYRGNKVLLMFLIIFIAYCISLFGYGRLISFLYPLFGYISFLFLALLAFKPIPSKG
jgi:uncharacterized membrane protein YkvI